MLNAEQLVARHGKLLIEDQQGWGKHREDYYKYVMPFRKPPVSAGVHTGDKSPPSVNDIWDSTAVVAAMRGSGRVQRSMTPDYEDWIGLGPGPAVPPEKREQFTRELDAITQVARGIFDQGGFGLAAGEFYQDLYAGECTVLVVRGSGVEELARFAAIPPEQVQTVEDSFGRIRMWLYEKRMCGYDIKTDWPAAKLPEKLAELITADDTAEHDILITCERVDRGSYEFKVIWKTGKAEIHREEMRTSPFITARFFKAPGQRRGLGPPSLAMATIKTVNKSVEFELKAAAFAILGAWMTTDDGVYNPRSTSLQPGGMLKVASTGGVRGPSLARLDIPKDFDLSRIATQELRIQIREMLFDDDLPYEGGSVRSPTEIVERLKRLVQHIAGAFGRLFAELIVPLVQRVLDIADQWGLLPFYPQIDNLLTKAQVISPLANAQMLEDVEKAVRWLELVGALYGPQEVQVQSDPDQVGPWLREKLGGDIKLQRPAEGDNGRNAVRKMMQDAAMQAYQAEAGKVARDQLDPKRGQPQARAA